MRHITALTLAALTGPALAQSSLRTATDVGVFVRFDSSAVSHDTIPADTPVTPEVAQRAKRAIIGSSPIAEARTKGSLRLVSGLPVARVHETGWISPLTTPATRMAGTAAKPGTAGSTPEDHAFLLRFQGTPGQRIRVHVQMRSTVVGTNPQSPRPTTIRGSAEVDVGDDNRPEFQRALDGKRYLGDHPVTLDLTGRIDVRIKTAALLSSLDITAAAYEMTLDVSIEPVAGVVDSFTPYGKPCGAKLFGISWTDGGARQTRLILDNAQRDAPALLLIGVDKIELALPGVLCPLLTSPLAVLGYRTDLGGRVITDFPQLPPTLPIDVRFQYGTVAPNREAHLSEGMHFRVFTATDRAYEHKDINHVLGTGQSLSIGGLGSPVLSSSQAHANVMFEGGLRAQSLKLVPLVESTWESMSSGMTNLVSQQHLTPFDDAAAVRPSKTHDVLVSLHGEPGYTYPLLRKGTQPFDNGMNQLRLAQLLADTAAQSHIVRCVTVVHGENDHTAYNNRYDQDMAEWQADYEGAVRDRGQVEPVPLLLSQLSSHTRYAAATSIIPQLQLAAAVRDPRKVVLVGPKYTLDYIDGVHLTSHGYRHLGEYYGKVYTRLILQGTSWEPLRPLVIRREGSVVTARFHVPEPPLVFDTKLVADPGSFGFEYWDDSSSPPRIQSVQLLDEDTVQITLSAAPDAKANKRLRYAHTGKPTNAAGPQTGARGNLRDSDPFPSLHAYPLFNWCVQFDLPIE